MEIIQPIFLVRSICDFDDEWYTLVNKTAFNALIKTQLYDNECYRFILNNKNEVEMEGYSLIAMWLRQGSPLKIYYINNEKELLNIYNLSISKGLITALSKTPTLETVYSCLAFEPLYTQYFDKFIKEIAIL